MILILGDPSWENMFVSLTAKYLQLDKFFNLQIIRTNNACLKAFNTVSFPCLLKEDGTKLNSIQSIAFELTQRVNLDEVLFGGEVTRQSVGRHFDVVNKEASELTKLYQDQLLYKTFLEDNHITMADLVAFCAFYPVIKNWTDSEKFEHNNVFRWYNHIQNLKGVSENWEGEVVGFPKRIDMSQLSKRE